MRLLAAALAAGTVFSAVQAEDWTYADRSAFAITMIDKDLIGRSGSHVRFWMRRIFGVERRIGIFGGMPMTAANVQGTGYYVESRSLIDVDCSTRTFTPLLFRFYSRDGRLVSEGVPSVPPTDAAFDVTITIGAGLFCRTP